MMQKLNKMFRKYDFYVFNKRLNVYLFVYQDKINDTTWMCNTKDEAFKASQQAGIRRYLK